MSSAIPALISGVSKWGIYAEIEENKCEGMISLGTLQDDYYYLDEDNYQVIGRRYGRQYKLGDSIKIKMNVLRAFIFCFYISAMNAGSGWCS